MLDKLKLASSAIWADLVDTYKRSKMLLIAIGAAIIYLEWQKIKEALTAYMAEKEMQKDKVEDKALAAQETTDNTQANALVKQSEQLPNTEQPVGVDWYKKDQK